MIIGQTLHISFDDSFFSVRLSDKETDPPSIPAFGSIISTLLLSDRVQFVSYRTVLDNRVYHLPSTFALNGTLNPTGCTSRRFDLQPFQSDRIGLPTISLHIHILVPYAPYTLMQQPTRLISNQIFQVSVNLRYSGRLYDYQPNPSHFL